MLAYANTVGAMKFQFKCFQKADVSSAVMSATNIEGVEVIRASESHILRMLIYFAER
jgi:hypothetical protein